jgi:hypothetical protein
LQRLVVQDNDGLRQVRERVRGYARNDIEAGKYLNRIREHNDVHEIRSSRWEVILAELKRDRVSVADAVTKIEPLLFYQDYSTRGSDGSHRASLIDRVGNVLSYSLYRRDGILLAPVLTHLFAKMQMDTPLIEFARSSRDEGYVAIRIRQLFANGYELVGDRDVDYVLGLKDMSVLETAITSSEANRIIIRQYFDHRVQDEPVANPYSRGRFEGPLYHGSYGLVMASSKLLKMIDADLSATFRNFRVLMGHAETELTISPNHPEYAAVLARERTAQSLDAVLANHPEARAGINVSIPLTSGSMGVGGIKPNVSLTPFMYAVAQRMWALADVMVKWGADIDAVFPENYKFERDYDSANSSFSPNYMWYYSHASAPVGISVKEFAARLGHQFPEVPTPQAAAPVVQDTPRVAPQKKGWLRRFIKSFSDI